MSMWVKYHHHTTATKLNKLEEAFALLPKFCCWYLLVFQVQLVHKIYNNTCCHFSHNKSRIGCHGNHSCITERIENIEYSTQPWVVFQGFYVMWIWARWLFLYQSRSETTAPRAGKITPLTHVGKLPFTCQTAEHWKHTFKHRHNQNMQLLLLEKIHQSSGM